MRNGIVFAPTMTNLYQTPSREVEKSLTDSAMQAQLGRGAGRRNLHWCDRMSTRVWRSHTSLSSTLGTQMVFWIVVPLRSRAILAKRFNSFAGSVFLSTTHAFLPTANAGHCYSRPGPSSFPRAQQRGGSAAGPPPRSWASTGRRRACQLERRETPPRTAATPRAMRAVVEVCSTCMVR